MSTSASCLQRQPLIAIIGATGTGKSDLAVELARRFNGEVINGDAMQLYEGLPIITNKMPIPERRGIPHHLLSCIGLDEPAWTVGQFVTNALQTISGIRSRGRLPILVGGTHYYTQALLFKDQIIEDEKAIADESLPILQQPTNVILAKLKEVDPVMADRWHPNDRRKIQRSLAIWLKTGKTASQTYAEQRQARESEFDSSNKPLAEDEIAQQLNLRFQTLVLWPHATPETLKARLDARVLTMVQNGLLDEVQALHNHRNTIEAAGEQIDRTRGIWVSIGYKEFEDYHTSLCSQATTEAGLKKLRAAAIERTQAATRQYSKRQERWIRIKLLNALSRTQSSNTTFLLDGSDISRWHETVAKPAIGLMEKFLLNEELPDPSNMSELAKEMLTPKADDLSQRPDLWERKTCDACGVTAVTSATWEKHIKSRGHRKTISIRKHADDLPGDRQFGGPIENAVIGVGIEP